MGFLTYRFKLLYALLGRVIIAVVDDDYHETVEEKDSEVLESAISQAKASEHTSTKGSSSRKSSGYYSMYSDPTRQELREEQSQVPYDDTAPSSPVAEEEKELECRSEEKVAGRVTFEGVTYYDGEYCSSL